MRRKPRNAILAAVCLLALGGMACTFSLFQIPTIPAISTQTATGRRSQPRHCCPRRRPSSWQHLPEPLQAGESLALGVLDEVTGLAFGPEVYPMQAGGCHQLHGDAGAAV